MSLLGIDVGTSGCKAAVFSTDGRMLSLAYVEYDVSHPQSGWAELDARSIWPAIQNTIRKAATSAETRRDPIAALSISSLGEAVVPVNASREILAPSILNFDVRGDEYLPGLGDSMPAERLYRINGNTLGSPYSLAKLIWLKQEQPALYARTDRFLLWGSFVGYMLGADAMVDYSLANRTLLFDLEKQDWSDELLDWAQLDREKLPPCVASGSVVGAVSSQAAETMGIPKGIPIVAGGHDQCCNSIGCGAIGEGAAMYGIGTYLCMVPVFTRRPDAAGMMARGLNTEHHAVPGHFVSFIYNQGGVLVKWFRDTFARAERQTAAQAGQDIYALLMAELPEEESKLMVLPHFTITGPPNFIRDSSGVIAGLKLETQRGEILKAILEASTFYLRESFEALPGIGVEVGVFHAAGGGSKSDRWVQLCADILGRPFIRPQVNEAGAMGAAILAGVGCGAYGSVQEGVAQMVKLDREFNPDPHKHRRYTEQFDKYRRLGPLLADYLRDL